MSKRTLTILVIDDEMAEHRQIRLTTTAIKLAIGSVAFLGVMTISFGLLWLGSYSHRGQMADLVTQNEELSVANERYLNATREIEKKLKRFDEKTTKLATLVGVETESSTVGGLGGADYFENELSQYLRYDLSLIEQKSDLIEQRLDTLDEAFKTQKELLDTTPSLLPAKGWITSSFAYRIDPFTRKRTFHPGIDISAPRGTPVYAPANGVIVYAGSKGGLGNLLEINHGNGIKTRYGHLNKFNVAKGERVKRGDLIGYIGSSGRSTGPHLHFEIRRESNAVDPMRYIVEDIRPY